MKRGGGKHALQQATDGAARAHVHGANLERNAAVTGVLVNINIIDPHNLPAVNINNLLVEQVAGQQQHALAAGIGDPICCRIAAAHAPINGRYLVGNQQPIAAAGLDDQTQDL